MFLRRLFEALIKSDNEPNTLSKSWPHNRLTRTQVPIIIPIVPPPEFYQRINDLQNPNKPARSNITNSKQTNPKTTKNDKHKRDRIPSDVRNNVWLRYHGERNQGNCYCCAAIIDRYHGGWHCSHVIADTKNGEETVENLRTCCQHCNLSMGDQNLYVYIQKKNLSGPGAKNVKAYLDRHPSQKLDKRTNNWGKRR
ncbi:Hypothetical protein HVR_LOCUS48 [uncultured virus]|nr:Hypothetical protein HVR_LOCUS48 [uncultured virus]